MTRVPRPHRSLQIPEVALTCFKAAFREAALGVLDRLVLSDAAWKRMAPLIIGRPDQKGSTGRDNRILTKQAFCVASSAAQKIAAC